MEKDDLNNPFIQPENYFEKYQENIDSLRNQPAVIEFDKLCYELFEMNPQGKKFLEICTDRYLIPGLAKLGSPSYKDEVIYCEGFKDFVRTIIQALRSHQQRIQAGTN